MRFWFERTGVSPSVFFVLVFGGRDDPLRGRVDHLVAGRSTPLQGAGICPYDGLVVMDIFLM